MPPKNYSREKDGKRFVVKGIDLTHPIDALSPGMYVGLRNVRAYRQGTVTSRATQAAPTFTLPDAVHSLRRLNDSTPLGPAAGFTLIGGAGDGLFANAVKVASGLSSNPFSIVPFRPNESVQPWAYIADSQKMLKVRSDGTCYAMGIAEPQSPPSVSTANSTTSGTVTVPGTTVPWIAGSTGQNPTYNFGDVGGTQPVVIHCLPGTQLQLGPSGTVNGFSAGGVGPSDTASPGSFVANPNTLMGAFTDAEGNVLSVITIGGGLTVTVPSTPGGITQLQLGIDHSGPYASNTGQFTVGYTAIASAIASIPSLIGTVTAYYWGDSPHSGGVAAYVWRNVTDTGSSATPRSIGDATGSLTGNSLLFDSTPASGANAVQWTTYDGTSTISGSKSLFQPALETEGYQDFNVVVVGSLFIPAAGTYTFKVTYKDNILWGIGGTATWPNKGNIRGAINQSMTVNGKYALLPAPTISGDGGSTGNSSVAVTFPGAGVYPIELNWDYWSHSGRTLTVKCNGADLPPLPATVKQDVQYRYVYRSSATGALSNPSPQSAQEQIPVNQNTLTAAFSPDPQVDKVDWYRIDAETSNYTYVGTGQNTNPPTPFVDAALDLAVSANQILQIDNFEPFPSIDLPRKGTVNVTAGVVTWASGDKFNTRWLPGTEINIGGTAYVFDKRPSSTTQLTAAGVVDGTGLLYEIPQPGLAGQPLPSMFGPTDGAAYMFACGDPLRPGTLYWTKGNNPDSAPDTNQQDVTSPSEPLINGVIVNGRAVVYSSERPFLVYPSFSNATATVSGVSGNTFTIIESGGTRGLYIRTCITTDGAGTIFFRAKDGICASAGGAKEQSITDEDLYALFPHEGFAPIPVARGPLTFYPPDDTQPEAQRLHFATGYLYYDYLDVSGTPRTLVYDAVAGGWCEDSYNTPVTLHSLEEGSGINGVLTGCQNGDVRALSSSGVEDCTCIVLTSCDNGGDSRGDMTVGDIFLRASVDTLPVTVNPYRDRYNTLITGNSPATLAPGTGSQPYVIDFVNGFAQILEDVELYLSWAGGTKTYLEVWQPSWTDLPENTQDRPTDYDDMGQPGTSFIRGMILQCDTFGQPKAIAVQSADDLSIHVPNESPITFNGQSKQALTFTPPFAAHSVRLISTDGVPWRLFDVQWERGPFPENAREWQTEMSSFGMTAWLSIAPVIEIAHMSTADISLIIVMDAWPTITVTIPNSGGKQAKTLVPIPRNKFKLVSFRLSSTQPFRVFAHDCEVRIGPWSRTDAYFKVEAFGGQSGPGAEV